MSRIFCLKPQNTQFLSEKGKKMNENLDQVQQQSIKVDLASADEIPCEECKNTYFSPVFVIKRISPLISPTGDEKLIPLQTFRCVDCGHVNKKFSFGKD